MKSQPFGIFYIHHDFPMIDFLIVSLHGHLQTQQLINPHHSYTIQPQSSLYLDLLSPFETWASFFQLLK